MNTLKHVAYIATTVFCFFLLSTDGTAQSASGQNPLMLLNRNNSGLPNGMTAPVVLGDTLGDIRFQGFISGVGHRPGATIQSYVSGPVGPDFVTSSLLFRTGTPRPVMRMTIRENGFVGVNTFTPQQLLTVSQATRPVIRFDRANGGELDYEVYAGNSGTLFFRGGGDGTEGALTDFMVLTSAGRLGLGTTAPDRLLTISANTEPIFRFNRSTAGGQDVELAASTDGDLFFRGGADGTTLNDLMVLKGNGKLAIGTLLTPNSLGGTDLTAYSLYAKGGILSEEVRVRTGWADYVFAPGYRLRSLEEVETHIAQFGHLPETPTAAQVEEQGLELGDNAVNQQAKIEELFLYMIEMNKQVKALQTENAALRARVEALENK